MTTAEATTIPPRQDVNPSDTWDLSKLFASDEAWEESFRSFEDLIPRAATFKETLGQSAQSLRAYLDYVMEIGLLEERLGYYAYLRVAEDLGNSESQGRMARYTASASKSGAENSFATPEIQAIPDDQMAAFLETDELKDFRIYLRHILRYKPHILSEPEEKLLAMQADFSGTPNKAFGALVDVDMDFGVISTEEGDKPLTHSTFSSFMQDEDRTIREKAYNQYLQVFDKHRNTLAALYNGSVKHDVYLSRVRNFSSARERSLFADDVPTSVYDALITAVRDSLPALHRYYDVRKRALELDELHMYDTRVPLVRDFKTNYTYEQAVELLNVALEPLGEEYVQTLQDGLLGRWVDRYENKGKRSGAFSAGSYAGDPYILMNYKNDVFDDIFTLAHEGGHSMHSWYSTRNNPFQHYSYTIFAAEVASTFNEELLARHLMDTTTDEQFQKYLLNKQLDDIIGTVYRQTMFAEFEKTTHEMAEKNEPLTVDSLREVYGELSNAYFGPGVARHELSDLVGLRIPHFYSAFYVYKYATGMSAALALAGRVLNGGDQELADYIGFLKSGGSAYPLEQLKAAGVDMTKPEPVKQALGHFSSLLDRFEELI